MRGYKIKLGLFKVTKLSKEKPHHTHYTFISIIMEIRHGHILCMYAQWDTVNLFPPPPPEIKEKKVVGRDRHYVGTTIRMYK